LVWWCTLANRTRVLAHKGSEWTARRTVVSDIKEMYCCKLLTSAVVKEKSNYKNFMMKKSKKNIGFGAEYHHL